MNKKYRFIVTVAAVCAVCAVGSFVKTYYESKNLNLDSFTPVDAENPMAFDAKNEDREEYIIKINLNTATYEQLCEINGIGDKTARSILEYRENHGGFKDVREIVMVDGIGEKTYEEIRKYLTVE